MTVSYFIQVLTGETPFRGVRITELGYAVVTGERPGKPQNAIGFSDPLWDFVQRCWDGDMKLRPKVAEVVTHLEEAVAGWVGLMPHCPQVENVASKFEEPVSHSINCEFGFLLPLYTSHRATAQADSYNLLGFLCSRNRRSHMTISISEW